MILLADSEGPDQTARMRRLIWAFIVHICPKRHILIARPFSEMNLISIIKDMCITPADVCHHTKYFVVLKQLRFTGKRSAVWVKYSADDTLKYFFFLFSQNTGFHISCTFSRMKYVSKPVFRENKKKYRQFVGC